VKKFQVTNAGELGQTVGKTEIDIANYIGKGLVKEEIKLQGVAFSITFEISVVPADQDDIASMTALTLNST
jgi:hypothetical protein